MGRLVQVFKSPWDLIPAAVVPPLQVFLREAARQRLQALLHGEVLRLIVALQRRFRALLERKNFVRMREAAACIQVGDRRASQTGFSLSVWSETVGFMLELVIFCGFNEDLPAFMIVNLTAKSICD